MNRFGPDFIRSSNLPSISVHNTAKLWILAYFLGLFHSFNNDLDLGERPLFLYNSLFATWHRLVLHNLDLSNVILLEILLLLLIFHHHIL